ncbi:MAG: SBBP repeat-containing protein [Terriglobia bacterium]|jgi:hypothetical protein
MLAALAPLAQSAARRRVTYAGCISSIVVAAVSFSLYGRLQVPRIILPKGGMPAVSQIRPRLNSNYAKLPLSFEANQGQANARVKFLSRGRGLTLFLAGNEAVLELQESAARIQDSGFRIQSRNPKSRIQNQVLRLRLDGAKKHAEAIGREELPGKVNYFIGNDPKKWRTNVPTYAQVRYHDVYPGVDLEYYGNQGGRLEYDFIVAPGADPNAIALHVGAVREPPLRIDANGDLVLPTKGSEVRFHKPEIYQPGESSSLITRHSSPVQGRFVLDARNRIRIVLGPYDHTKPLVIDPVLSYSTYLGGSGPDYGNAIAVDSSGSAYVAGQTESVDFPTTNPFQASLNGDADVFVSKLNATGTGLVYSTYLGGSGGDSGYGIAVDSIGNAYVGGITSSTDFPTVNPFQANNKSPANGNGFVAKLNASGSALIYSTYLGGSGGDSVQSIALDSPGNAYLTGWTQSMDFPTVNPLQATNKVSSGYSTGFVAKLDPTGTALVYSTYLGGSGVSGVGGDQSSAIAVDSSGSVYVTGYTQSSDFPTANPLQATNKGAAPSRQNAFVAKLDPAGSALVYSTYLGGSGAPGFFGGDLGSAIAVDSSGSAYVTGTTQSTDFPTVNPLQATNKGVGPIPTNAFVAKLNPAGTALVYSTYLGGSAEDFASGIAVGASGNAYVVGTASSTDFPTANPVEATNNSAGLNGSGPATAFVAELNAAGSALIYSTYLGGSVIDQANAVAVDTSGNAYITGNAFSSDFPTVNPLQPTSTDNNPHEPSSNAFVAELSPGPAPSLSFSPSAVNFGLVAENTASQQTVTVTNLGNAPLSITGITSSGDFAVVAAASTCLSAVQTVAPEANCTVALTFTPTALSARTGTLTVTDSAFGSPHVLQLTGTGALSAPVISPSYLEFTAYIGTSSSPQTVTLTNTASAVLAVGAVTFADDNDEWAQTNNCLPSIGPNASCTINVVFQPTVGGPHESTLTVTDDAVNSPQTVGVEGQGNSQGSASLASTSLTFGDQPVGTTSSPQTIMLINPNNGGYGIPLFATTGDFSMDPDGCVSELGLTVDLPCAFAVWFTPTSAGTRTGTVTVTYGQPKPLTLTASLTGTGVWPGVGLSPASVNFPAQTVSTKSAPQMITLTNTGNAALSPLKITRSGPFAETNNCGGSVAVGASCAISVTFSPIDAGSGSGTLALTDNAGTQTIPVSGTGMDFAVTSSTTTQTVSAGQTAKYSLTLAPQGGFNQAVNLACTGAPSESTCTLTPSTVTLNGTASTTVAVAVSTTASSLAPPHVRFLPPGMTGLGRVFWLCALLWLASVAALATARKRRAAWLLGTGLLLVVLWSACGGGTTAPPPSSPGTLAGTYTVDVTATDAAVSTLTHTIQLTLTVN